VGNQVRHYPNRGTFISKTPGVNIETVLDEWAYVILPTQVEYSLEAWQGPFREPLGVGQWDPNSVSLCGSVGRGIEDGWGSGGASSGKQGTQQDEILSGPVQVSLTKEAPFGDFYPLALACTPGRE
jgi:hypothetical protein